MTIEEAAAVDVAVLRVSVTCRQSDRVGAHVWVGVTIV
jgi:hypothetical protein